MVWAACRKSRKGAVTRSNSYDDESDDSFDSSRAARPILAVIVATAVLYLGADILMPLAMASMFAVIFSPVATRLEPYVGGLISGALIVLAAVVTLVMVGYFLTVELTEVAVVNTIDESAIQIENQCAHSRILPGTRRLCPPFDGRTIFSMTIFSIWTHLAAAKGNYFLRMRCFNLYLSGAGGRFFIRWMTSSIEN